MYVTCPACAARYKTDEQKLRGKTARMRCRACDTVWLVSGPASIEEQTLDAPTLDGPAPRASVKRGGERDKRDLFAKRPSDPGVVRQTLRPGPKPQEEDTLPPMSGLSGQGGHVAARNENSVLFTLAGLTGSARAARLKTPEPERTPMAQTKLEDDEGIIDLKALASTPPAAGTRPVVMPLFSSEPPPAAFVRDAGSSAEVSASSASRFGAKQILAIAGALAAVLLVGFGLRYAFRGEEPAAVSAAPAPPPPAAVAAPAPAPEPAPVITASTSTDDVKATPATGKKGKPAKGGKAASGGAKVSSAKTEAASKPAASKPAADPCGCKGDFNCVLACTVKKGK